MGEVRPWMKINVILLEDKRAEIHLSKKKPEPKVESLDHSYETFIRNYKK